MNSQNKGLKNHTVILMIVTAIFFDVLQWFFTFIFLGWLVGFFAFLTFFMWFMSHGISFMKPKRFLVFSGTTLAEIIPFLSIIPAWTAAVSYLALSSKLQEVIPGSGVIKLDIMKR
jgi:hypothetical protein